MQITRMKQNVDAKKKRLQNEDAFN